MRFFSSITFLLLLNSLAWSAPDTQENRETARERFLQRNLAFQKQRDFFENCQEGKNLEAIKSYLSDPRVDVNAVANDSGATALLRVIHGYDEYNSKSDNFWDSADHLSVLKILLGQPEIDVNKSNAKGETALQITASMGYINALKLLLAQAAIDVNRADKEGRTALMGAMSGRELESVKLLLASDTIDVNAVDNDGDSAFSLSIYSSIYSEDLRFLTALLDDRRLSRTKLLGASDFEALIFAAEYGDLTMLEYLLSNFEVDINQLDQYGRTALLAATNFNLWLAGDERVGIVRLLLTYPNIDTGVKYEGLTALMQANENAYPQIVEVLTAAGVTE